MYLVPSLLEWFLRPRRGALRFEYWMVDLQTAPDHLLTRKN